MSKRDLGETFKGLAAFYNALVPDYIGRTYRPLVCKIKPWDSPAFAQPIAEMSLTRANKRIAGYVDMAEVERVRAKLLTKDNASIRFGVQKTGHGYLGERGDFCLIGGAIRDGHLTVFYRRLELIGGWAFDVVLIDKLYSLLCQDDWDNAPRPLGFKGDTWKSVQIMAVQADVYALRDGSGEKEKLFKKLQGLYS